MFAPRYCVDNDIVAEGLGVAVVVFESDTVEPGDVDQIALADHDLHPELTVADAHEDGQRSCEVLEHVDRLLAVVVVDDVVVLPFACMYLWFLTEVVFVAAALWPLLQVSFHGILSVSPKKIEGEVYIPLRSMVSSLRIESRFAASGDSMVFFEAQERPPQGASAHAETLKELLVPARFPGVEQTCPSLPLFVLFFFSLVVLPFPSCSSFRSSFFPFPSASVR
eukprot:m.128941 g.128941  ORF g.128941 m.128941 type:complete len:223 (-) comp15685_c1_seq1:482-1150(-)